MVVRHKGDIRVDSIREYELLDEVHDHILKDELIEMCRMET